MSIIERLKWEFERWRLKREMAKWSREQLRQYYCRTTRTVA